MKEIFYFNHSQDYSFLSEAEAAAYFFEAKITDHTWVLSYQNNYWFLAKDAPFFAELYKWYFRKENAVHGPFFGKEIKELLLQGRIHSTTAVRKVDEEAWEPLNKSPLYDNQTIEVKCLPELKEFFCRDTQPAVDNRGVRVLIAKALDTFAYVPIFMFCYMTKNFATIFPVLCTFTYYNVWIGVKGPNAKQSRKKPNPLTIGQWTMNLKKIGISDRGQRVPLILGTIRIWRTLAYLCFLLGMTGFMWILAIFVEFVQKGK